MLLLLATACAVEVEVEAASGTWDSKLSPKKTRTQTPHDWKENDKGESGNKNKLSLTI